MRKIINILCLLSVAVTGFAADEFGVAVVQNGANNGQQVVKAQLTDDLFIKLENRKYNRNHFMLNLTIDRIKAMIEKLLNENNANEAADFFQALYEKDPKNAFILMDGNFEPKMRHKLLMALPDTFLGEFLQRMSINGKDIVGGEKKWCFVNKKDPKNPTDYNQNTKHIRVTCDYEASAYKAFAQRYIWFILEYTPIALHPAGMVSSAYAEIVPITSEDYNKRLAKVAGMLNHCLSTLGVQGFLKDVMNADDKANDAIKALRDAIKKDPAVTAKVAEFIGLKAEDYNDVPAELLAFEPIKKNLAELKRAKAIEILAAGDKIESRLPGEYVAHILYAFSQGSDKPQFILTALESIHQNGKYKNYLIEVLKNIPCSYLGEIMPNVNQDILTLIFDKCFNENSDEFFTGIGVEVNNDGQGEIKAIAG